MLGHDCLTRFRNSVYVTVPSFEGTQVTTPLSTFYSAFCSELNKTSRQPPGVSYNVSAVKQTRSEPAGIKEIAKALGISIGTVDRALHARQGVSPKTRAKVLKMAEKLDYKPNVAARSLKLNRRVRIAVHLPQQIKSFFDPLRAGVRAAAEATLGATVDLDFVPIPVWVRAMWS